ncbi:hypothetical protein FB451DRAFT_1228571 [Mycena latifolia]|nr:hypothetical protein FB451DRAFT_1228571 [Mycena latifolia]
MGPRSFLFHRRPIPCCQCSLTATDLHTQSAVIILATVEPQPVTPCHAADKVRDQMPANPAPPQQGTHRLPRTKSFHHHQRPAQLHHGAGAISAAPTRHAAPSSPESSTHVQSRRCVVRPHLNCSTEPTGTSFESFAPWSAPKSPAAARTRRLSAVQDLRLCAAQSLASARALAGRAGTQVHGEN